MIRAKDMLGWSRRWGPAVTVAEDGEDELVHSTEGRKSQKERRRLKKRDVWHDGALSTRTSLSPPKMN